ncbi:RTX family exoprotein A [Escherichia coli]|uniref:RTX family exoprotein A n=1 Tax=Escherichia coli TaxID=562 RepID=A0A377KDQ9_ECOLX|nr:RTX family exoprotein A [Escherichia coli]
MVWQMPRFLSIPEVTDGYANADELKDGLQAEVTLPAGTAEGAVYYTYRDPSGQNHGET